MSTILDILASSKFGREFLVGKFKELLRQGPSGEGFYGRLFNDFPCLLPAREMEILTSEFIDIMKNAKMIEAGKKDKDELALSALTLESRGSRKARALSAVTPLTLDPRDFRTKEAVKKWFDKVTFAACEQLLDPFGNPSEYLMDFLRLDEGEDKGERKALTAHISGMLSSFTENIAGTIRIELFEMSKKDSGIKDNVFSGIHTYAGAQVKQTHYYDGRLEEYKAFGTNMMELTTLHKDKFNPMTKEMEAQLAKELTTLSETERDSLKSKIEGYKNVIKAIVRYTSNITNSTEFLNELKVVQRDGPIKYKLFLFNLTKSDPELDQFVKKVDDAIQAFHAGKAPPTPAPATEEKEKPSY